MSIVATEGLSKHYGRRDFRPVVVLQGGGWPLEDMAVLFVIGVFFWTLAGIIIDRRDICTV